MKKSPFKRLTPVELEIMKVLWQSGPGTVQAVREKLPGDPRPAYTTVQTMLNVLLRKGKVKRTLKGQAYEYSPAVSKRAAMHDAVRDLLNNLFAGSAEDLVMSLVEHRHLTPEKLAKLTEMVEQNRRAKEKGHDG